MPEFVYVLVSNTFGSIMGVHTDPDVANIIAAANSCDITKVRLDGAFPGHIGGVEAIFGRTVSESVQAKTITDLHNAVRYPRTPVAAKR